MWGRILIFSCVLPWPTAGAAPWIQEEGVWYTRAALVSETVEGLNGYRADAYLEYGLSDEWTVTLKGEAVRYTGVDGFDSRGWRATARRLIYDTNRLKVSGEVGLLQGSAIGGRNGCDRLGAEARMGVSWSSRPRRKPYYLYMEGVGRFHGSCERQRLEAGYGIRPYASIWTITQVWIERGASDAKSDKIQTEIVWNAERFDFSVGVRREVGNAFDEEGVFLAIARRF